MFADNVFEHGARHAAICWPSLMRSAPLFYIVASIVCAVLFYGMSFHAGTANSFDIDIITDEQLHGGNDTYSKLFSPCPDGKAPADNDSLPTRACGYPSHGIFLD